MKMVYTSPDQGLIHLAKTVLEHRGIECIVRGEHLATASGGVAPIDAWLELWVPNQYAVYEAEEIIEEVLEAPEPATDPWICPECIEWIEGQFSHCWNCGAERLA